ncbi:MAG: hypothetical protein LPJ98_09535 [Cyclobacteriaceae bacterium]|mgnify:CR=1 FL=1|nr:hypothetical protein [Cyclobacteriaceae bacterium]
MKYRSFLYLIFAAVFSISCNQQINTRQENLNEGFEFAGDGGDIDIPVVTWGDAPIWLEIVDAAELEKIAQDINVLDNNDIKIFDNSVFELRKGDWETIIDNLNNQNKESSTFFWERKNGVSVSSSGTLLISFDDLDDFTFQGQPLINLDIKFIKDNFPKSYAARNLPGDPFKQNFIDYSPKAYDHVRFKIVDSESELHLRFVDGNPINISIE